MQYVALSITFSSAIFPEKNTFPRLRSHIAAQNSPSFSATLLFSLFPVFPDPHCAFKYRLLSTCQLHTQPSKSNLWENHLPAFTCNQWRKRSWNSGGYFILRVLWFNLISCSLTWQGSKSTKNCSCKMFCNSLRLEGINFVPLEAQVEDTLLHNLS